MFERNNEQCNQRSPVSVQRNYWKNKSCLCAFRQYSMVLALSFYQLLLNSFPERANKVTLLLLPFILFNDRNVASPQLVVKSYTNFAGPINSALNWILSPSCWSDDFCLVFCSDERREIAAGCLRQWANFQLVQERQTDKICTVLEILVPNLPCKIFSLSQ